MFPFRSLRMKESRKNLRPIRVLLLAFATLVTLAVLYWLWDQFLPPDRVELLPSQQAAIMLTGLLKSDWDVKVDLPSTGVYGAIMHPGGLGQGDDSAWFNFRDHDPESFVACLVKAVKNDPRTKVIEPWPQGMDIGQISSRPRDLPGWWKPDAPPKDLRSYRIVNRGQLLIRYSLLSGAVYFELQY